MEFVDICGGRGLGSVRRWRASLPRCIGVILALLLLLGLLCVPCAGQSDYELRDAMVTPDYGYGDFNYSAKIGITGTTTDVSGKYKVVLRIYDGDRLLREASSMERRLSNSEIGNRLSEPFLFGPFNFQRDFGIVTTKNASFEFVLLKSGTEQARSSLRGPEVEPPHIIGTPQFNAKPYFFQGLSVSTSFKDQAGLAPSAHIELKGPLGTDLERSWNTGELACSGSGTVYTSRILEDTSSYREGGNFSFEFVYNNLRMDPMVFGPYNFTVMPYTPSIERFSVAPAIDYTNFTIRAFVSDEGARTVGGSTMGSRADLIISHPSKGSVTYADSQPRVEGGYLVFEWDETEVPFDRGDVDLSDPRKGGQPFEARLVYVNDNWDFGVESSNVSFIVVEEVPTLDLRYSPVVYMRSGQIARESITATIGFSKGAGEARLALAGPGLDYNRTVEGTSLGGNKYRYEWQLTLDDSNSNHNYTLSLAFLHPALEGGSFEFEGRNVSVRPISVEYRDSIVLPSGGRWNESFAYSTNVDSSVDCEIMLQIFNPCSREWEDWSSKKVSAGISALNWTLNPFRYECPGMEGSTAMYRFKASFQGVDYISRPFFGPFISASAPMLVSFDLSPTVYVPVGGSTIEAVRATVEYAGGMGDMRLIVSGPGLSFDETSAGVALGGDRYRYDWTVPFRYSHANNNYTATLSFSHPSLAGGYLFENRTVEVRPIYLAFEEGSVVPSRGRWNDSFLYSVKVNSTTDMDLALQIYNPCSMEWEDREGGAVGRGTSSLNWTLSPYEYSCPDITGALSRYRFKARFDDIEYGSRVYYGPQITGGQPELISLDYDREVYVSEGSLTYQRIRATIDSPLGQGVSQLRVYGPGKSVDVSSPGQPLGGDKYAYWWSIPFGVENVGNHTISLRFLHPELEGGGYSFADAPMEVLLVEGMPAEPQLVDLNYTPLLLIDGDEVAYQEIESKVASLAGAGELKLSLTGPDKDLEEFPEAEEMGSNIYRYRWSVPFDRSNDQNTYKISLAYILGENSYALGDRMMAVAMRDGPAPKILEPTLTVEYDRTLYVPRAGSADQIVRATVNYSLGMGKLELNISGAGMDFSGIEEGRRANGQRYLYEWSVPFNSSHIDESYTLALTYMHPSLPGESYRFADRYMQVKAASGGEEARLAFENAQVLPENGSSFTHFAYYVDLKTDLDEADVELLTSDPGSSIWTSQGLVHYDGSNATLCWPDVMIDGESYGLARYRFKYGTAFSNISQGPALEEPSALVVASVDPIEGSLYSTTPLIGEISRVYTYTFTADVRGSLGEGSTEVRLDVYDPVARRWINAGSQTYDPSRTRLLYLVNFAGLSFQELFLNETKYRFVARDRILGEFPGPNITVNLRSERAIRVGDKITYQVDVRSVQPAKIALAYTTDNVHWHRSDSRDYDLADEGWKTLEWEEYPRYYAYEFEVMS
ncbi:MAG: hypothetical protein JW986_08685 [Methanotrichaceae archaeon]|nr:hypothetical protein [Methanotrichaceae archaeon]